MARYSVSAQSITLTAVADTVAFTNSVYPFFLQGGTTTQQLKVNEIEAGGESTASAVCALVFGRDSTVGATAISGVFNALMDAAGTAPATTAVAGNVSTTKPQRSATLGHLITHSFNAFGGIVRWQARQGEEITIVGNTASLGECSYSAFTGSTGIVSAHCIYEVV